MKVKRLFNYKNTQYDEQLMSVPHNFAFKHDTEKGESELTIYGVIGESYWSERYTSAIDVDNALKEASGNNLVIRLNSPGGSAFDGIAIYNRLMSYKKTQVQRLQSMLMVGLVLQRQLSQWQQMN